MFGVHSVGAEGPGKGDREKRWKPEMEEEGGELPETSGSELAGSETSGSASPRKQFRLRAEGQLAAAGS